jgi:hypothetical protein
MNGLPDEQAHARARPARVLVEVVVVGPVGVVATGVRQAGRGGAVAKYGRTLPREATAWENAPSTRSVRAWRM